MQHAEYLAEEHGSAELWAQHSDRLARGDRRSAKRSAPFQREQASRRTSSTCLLWTTGRRTDDGSAVACFRAREEVGVGRCSRVGLVVSRECRRGLYELRHFGALCMPTSLCPTATRIRGGGSPDPTRVRRKTWGRFTQVGRNLGGKPCKKMPFCRDVRRIEPVSPILDHWFDWPDMSGQHRRFARSAADTAGQGRPPFAGTFRPRSCQ